MGVDVPYLDLSRDIVEIKVAVVREAENARLCQKGVARTKITWNRNIGTGMTIITIRDENWKKNENRTSASLDGPLQIILIISLNVKLNVL